MISPLIDFHVFNMALSNTLSREGGFNNDPDDPGGATKYGISLRFLRQQDAINGDLDDDGEIDINDIQALSLDDATKIYYRDFWQANNYDLIIDSLIAMKIFDLCVNMGQKSANILLQRAVNDTIGKIACLEDGVIGPKTISLLNYQDPSIVIKNLRIEAKEHYEFLVELNPKLSKYLNGWLIRANA